MVKKIEEMSRATFLLWGVEIFWNDVPHTYSEIDSWDEMVALDYIEDEIPMQRRLMKELDGLHERGELAAEEEVRYQGVKGLEVKYGGYVEKMRHS